MGDLSKNLSRHEVSCQCGCGLDTVDAETVAVVQEACDHFAREAGVDRVILHVNSGARCFEYNRIPRIGSNDASQHPRCRALDILIEGVAPSAVYQYIDERYPGRYGVGKYSTFTHIDTRTNGPARW